MLICSLNSCIVLLHMLLLLLQCYQWDTSSPNWWQLSSKNYGFWVKRGLRGLRQSRTVVSRLRLRRLCSFERIYRPQATMNSQLNLRRFLILVMGFVIAVFTLHVPVGQLEGSDKVTPDSWLLRHTWHCDISSLESLAFISQSITVIHHLWKLE